MCAFISYCDFIFTSPLIVFVTFVFEDRDDLMPVCNSAQNNYCHLAVYKSQLMEAMCFRARKRLMISMSKTNPFLLNKTHQ